MKGNDIKETSEEKKKEMSELMFWVCFSTDLSMPYCIYLALPMNVGYLLCNYLFYCSTHPESF